MCLTASLHPRPGPSPTPRLKPVQACLISYPIPSHLISYHLISYPKHGQACLISSLHPRPGPSPTPRPKPEQAQPNPNPNPNPKHEQACLISSLHGLTETQTREADRWVELYEHHDKYKLVGSLRVAAPVEGEADYTAEDLEQWEREEVDAALEAEGRKAWRKFRPEKIAG